MSNQQPPLLGSRAARSTEELLGHGSQGQICGRCGVVNSASAVRCAWCEIVLKDAKPDPAPETRRIGPEPIPAPAPEPKKP
jgi:hypothetical protein